MSRFGLELSGGALTRLSICGGGGLLRHKRAFNLVAGFDSAVRAAWRALGPSSPGEGESLSEAQASEARAAGSQRAPLYRGSGGTVPRDPAEGRGHRVMELLKGTTMETLSSEIVCTKLERIAKLAQQAPTMVLTTLSHYIDLDWLREAYRRTRKDAAPGVDQQTAEQYAGNLEVQVTP